MEGISGTLSLMKKHPNVTELYKRKEAHRKNEAKRPISEKMVIASRLREVQDKLAPIRAANKAKRSQRKVEIPVSRDQD
jgi:tetrahydromethanopterin S-methyltransferase subunit A